MYNRLEQCCQHPPIDCISRQVHELAPAQSRQVERAGVEGLDAEGFRGRQIPLLTIAFVDGVPPTLHMPVGTRQGAYKGPVPPFVNLHAPPTPPSKVSLPLVTQVLEV